MEDNAFAELVRQHKILVLEYDKLSRAATLQNSRLVAITAWSCEKIARLTGEQVETLQGEVEGLTQKILDESILRIGDTDPDAARLLDPRPLMPDGGSDEWQFPTPPGPSL